MKRTDLRQIDNTIAAVTDALRTIEKKAWMIEAMHLKNVFPERKTGRFAKRLKKLLTAYVNDVIKYAKKEMEKSND